MPGRSPPVAANCSARTRAVASAWPAAQCFISRDASVSDAPVAARVEILPARSADEIATVKSLFLEYANSLGVSLCFQGFDEELAELPGAYAPPRGRLYLVHIEGAAAGCVGLRPLDSS